MCVGAVGVVGVVVVDGEMEKMTGEDVRNVQRVVPVGVRVVPRSQKSPFRLVLRFFLCAADPSGSEVKVE